MDDSSEANHRTFIWAHRGASGYEVENTLESFKLAIEMGADGIESDVHLSKDRSLVFYHDQRILWNERRRRPSHLRLNELISIDLANGRKIPEVGDIFDFFRPKTTRSGHPIRYSLDLGTIYAGRPLIKLSHKKQVASQVEITPDDNYPTFWWRVSQFRALSSEINLVSSAKFDWYKFKHATHRMFFQNWDRFHQLGLKAVNIQAKYATRGLIEETRRQGLKIYVWDCHDEQIIRKFLKLGVDAIYSNFPDLAVKLREEIQS